MLLSLESPTARRGGTISSDTTMTFSSFLCLHPPLSSSRKQPVAPGLRHNRPRRSLMIMPRKTRRLPWSLVILGLILCAGSFVRVVVDAMPLQLKIRQGDRECFLESLKAGESATISAIVLQGDQLKANLQFDGPVLDSPPDETTSIDLKNALARIDVGQLPSDTSTYIHFVDTIDFEHLNDHEDEEGMVDDFMYDDDDTAKLPEAEREAAKEKKRQMKERKKALEAKNREERKKANRAEKVRNEGEPFLKTFKTTKAGWYRFCVVANFYEVTVEADYRKESELGGLDENGDVLTYEEKLMMEEDRMMEADTASEEGIKDEDFIATKEKLKTLRRLLSEIQSKQQQERHRLSIHSQTNEHSHSRMVLGSLLETLLFMVVTGIQVATIRRWFRGAPVLGR